MTEPATAACCVFGCDEDAVIEFVWSERTAVAMGWLAGMSRVYCERCFRSKVHRHPWDMADEVRRLAHV